MNWKTLKFFSFFLFFVLLVGILLDGFSTIYGLGLGLVEHTTFYANLQNINVFLVLYKLLLSYHIQ